MTFGVLQPRQNRVNVLGFLGRPGGARASQTQQTPSPGTIDPGGGLPVGAGGPLPSPVGTISGQGIVEGGRPSLPQLNPQTIEPGNALQTVTLSSPNSPQSGRGANELPPLSPQGVSQFLPDNTGGNTGGNKSNRRNSRGDTFSTAALFKEIRRQRNK